MNDNVKVLYGATTLYGGEIVEYPVKKETEKTYVLEHYGRVVKKSEMTNWDTYFFLDYETAKKWLIERLEDKKLRAEQKIEELQKMLEKWKKGE